jgi:hypothetical protein
VRARTVLLVCAFAVGACRSKKSEPAPTPSAPAAASPEAVVSAPVPPAEPEPEPPELPTESDFEQEAAEHVTGTNLERELERLEKELLGR